MADLEECPPLKKNKQQTRVWVDGVFDFAHFGHANMLRQAKAFGDYLIVGIHSDAEVMHVKGCPPVLNEQERYKMIRAIKWVDEVAEDVPYSLSLETLDKYNCDFVVHGEDIAVDANGRDAYEEVKKAGRYRECKRTHGVSTTNLIHRILKISNSNDVSEEPIIFSPYTGMVDFLASTRKIKQFCGDREPTENDLVVYCPGYFDLFHVGHVDFLEKARSFGTYLIVGLYDDDVVMYCKGESRPLMTLHERVLSCLGCKYVDEVVIAAPYCISEDLLKHFKVKVVVHGKTDVKPSRDGKDPFQVPKKLKVYQAIDSSNSMSSSEYIKRICDNHAIYSRRNSVKEAKEIKNLKVLAQ